jgi:hypothetical protein
MLWYVQPAVSTIRKLAPALRNVREKQTASSDADKVVLKQY